MIKNLFSGKLSKIQIENNFERIKYFKFLGFLNLQTLSFVWDQLIISSDVTGYHEEFIPIITAVILMILRDQLMSTKTVLKFISFINYKII